MIERLAEYGWKPHRICVAQKSLSLASVWWYVCFSRWDLTAISPTIISEETKPWLLTDILPEGEISFLKFNACVETIVDEIVAKSP